MENYEKLMASASQIADPAKRREAVGLIDLQNGLEGEISRAKHFGLDKVSQEGQTEPKAEDNWLYRLTALRQEVVAKRQSYVPDPEPKK